jgi:hypothetical protein
MSGRASVRGLRPGAAGPQQAARNQARLVQTGRQMKGWCGWAALAEPIAIIAGLLAEVGQSGQEKFPNYPFDKAAQG